MATAAEWLEGARLRTLPASASPVIAGSGIAWFAVVDSAPAFSTPVSAWTVVAPLLCLVVALGLQIGSNFANDYSDGIRGTDAHRVGPMRLVGSGAATPAAVKRAAIIAFALACVAGLILVFSLVPGLFTAAFWHGLGVGSAQALTSLLLPLVVILVGLACVLAAWFYTGGKRPYGYAGFGELFVFIFFGLVAAIGTSFVQAPLVCPGCGAGQICDGCLREIAWAPTILTGVVMGCYSTAILVANNLRDLASDKQAGKITLPVRLGDGNTRVFYLSLLVAAALCLVVISLLTTWYALLSLLGLVLVARPALRVRAHAVGAELIHVLKRTGQAELASALLLVVGLGLGWL